MVVVGGIVTTPNFAARLVRDVTALLQVATTTNPAASATINAPFDVIPATPATTAATSSTSVTPVTATAAVAAAVDNAAVAPSVVIEAAADAPGPSVSFFLKKVPMVAVAGDGPAPRMSAWLGAMRCSGSQWVTREMYQDTPDTVHDY